MTATLSVLLCAFNEEATIQRQLDAILAQSRLPDELILLDDGSTDSTGELMSFARYHPRFCGDLLLLRNHQPSGASQATNYAASRATGDWLYSASAYDVVQPGAFAKWENTVRNAPEAKLICGDYVGASCGWSKTPALFTPDDLVKLWQGRFAWINTEATFIRRDIRKDEIPELQWLADVWQLHIAALEHGLVYVPFNFTKRNLRDRDTAGRWGDKIEMKKVAAKLAEVIKEHSSENLGLYANRLLKERFLRTGLLEVPELGNGMVRGML